MSSHPRTYDYSSPTRTCDVVMKGGITSGVVYPHAICELAQTYRFVSIGGTSAGAIAAAAAAAAEHGRAAGGFGKLAELPEWVGGGTHLFDLFQPQDATRGAYQTFSAGLGRKGLRKWARVIATALRHWWLAAAVGALPGAAVAAAGLVGESAGLVRAAAVAAGILLALLGAALGLVLWIALRLPPAVTGNHFGLCTGMPTRQDAPALTPWLADLIDDLAGKTDGTPLTIGDLRARGIELAMMTTNLTQRRPHRLPWDEQVFFFDPNEWRELFPERVVRWLVDHGPPPGGDEEDAARTRAAMLPRLPFPAADDLPVVVAARMSLSFPVLISAIPLWAFDRTLGENNRVLAGRGRPDDEARPERCWFSDGGITSNFPVHFFDTPLPIRPTFAIDLDGFHPDFPKAGDEAENVWLPTNNVGGILRSWYRFPDRDGFGRLQSFVSGIVRTMQNHVDTTLTHQPGYRDRIVHVHCDADEGGMNLTMPAPVIDALTRRGREAAKLLVEAFASDEPASAWDNHRWVRYRSSAAALAQLLEQLAAGWNETSAERRSYRALLERPPGAPPRSYRMTAAQRVLALDVSERLAAAAARVAEARPTELGGENAPHPEPEARIVPKV